MQIAATIFLAYLCLLLPFVAWRSSRRAATEPSSPRWRAYVSTMFFYCVTLCLSLFAAHFCAIELYPSVGPGLREWLIGAAALVILLTIFFAGMNRGTISPTTRWFAPQIPGESLLFVIMAAFAAVAEETAYRGVAYQLFSGLLDNRTLAALASAFAFGLAHRLQGVRAVVLTILIGLFDQLVVHLTGSLYIMIGVHFLYDVIGGLTLAVKLWKETLSA